MSIENLIHRPVRVDDRGRIYDVNGQMLLKVYLFRENAREIAQAVADAINQAPETKPDGASAN